MQLCLRARFALAVTAVTIVLIAVFGTAMAFFIEVLEHELLHDTLSRELAEHRDLLTRDPDWPDLSGDQLTRMVVDQDDLPNLPRPLRDLGTNLKELLTNTTREKIDAALARATHPDTRSTSSRAPVSGSSSGAT